MSPPVQPNAARSCPTPTPTPTPTTPTPASTPTQTPTPHPHPCPCPSAANVDHLTPIILHTHACPRFPPPTLQDTLQPTLSSLTHSLIWGLLPTDCTSSYASHRPAHLHLLLWSVVAFCPPSPSSTLLTPYCICSRTHHIRASFLAVLCCVLQHAFPKFRSLHRSIRLVDVVGFVGSLATPNPNPGPSFVVFKPRTKTTSLCCPSHTPSDFWFSCQLLRFLFLYCSRLLQQPSALAFVVDKPRSSSNCAIDTDMYPRAASST